MISSPAIASTKPCVYTTDLPSILSLSGRFAAGDLFNMPETLSPGMHIILVDKHTPEVAVRQGIYRILASGNEPQIYHSQQPLAILVADESVSSEELSVQIMEFSQDCDRWLKTRSQQKLSLQEAVQIAQVVIAYEQGSERSVQLGTLRSRCDEKSYDWNNIIRELEGEQRKQITPEKNIPYYQQTSFNANQNRSVTGDSHFSGDTSNPDRVRFTTTVTTVTEILDLGFTDYEEQQLLEDICQQSGLSKGAFWKLVSSQKNKIDSLQPEDEIKLNSLINWHNAKLDFKKALPSMAVDFEHDAQILNIDPIVLWQPFLAAVMSLVGRKISLDMQSHMIPAIAWTMTVMESGGGKTRADKVILTPIRKLQSRARSKFLAEMKEFENPSEKPVEGEERPTRPVEEKYLFEVATIQAVMRRASEQPGKRGQLWARDEIGGLFKSLGQFGSGENEGKEILLKMWDGDAAQVDRVHQEDSFFIDETAISLTGGMQPGIYRDIFKDPKDSQGQTARFLIANAKPLKPKRVKGYCQLSDKLPPLYDWLINLPETVIKPSSAADRYYDSLYDQIGEQAHNTSQPAIRAWMYKLPANLLRIALALHFIECYHDRNRDFGELQKDTLQRAVLFAQYYRSAFHIIQETTTDNDDISSVLLKIWDAAATKHPDGITTRDAYRNIKAIQYRAKDMGRDVSAYTAELFGMLEAKGKGRVVKNGRTIKFIANIGGTDPDVPDPNIKPNITPGSSQEEVPLNHFRSENPIFGDRVTVAESSTVHGLEVSPQNLVSPVTVLNHSQSTRQIETTKSYDEAPVFEEPEVENQRLVIPVKSSVDNQNCCEKLCESDAGMPIEDKAATTAISETITSDSVLVEAEKDNSYSLLQFEKDGGDIAGFVGCPVEVRSLSGAVKFTGEMTSFNEKNGIVSIMTEQGNRDADFREAFVIG